VILRQINTINSFLKFVVKKINTVPPSLVNTLERSKLD